MREGLGGKEMVVVGDVLELEGVVKGEEGEIVKGLYGRGYLLCGRVLGEIEVVWIEVERV